MTYTIGKIKTFNGREGQGLNATITLNGKAICFVMDDASGGEVDYDYRNPEQSKKSFDATTNEMARAAERALGDYCLSRLSDAERAQAYADVHQRNEAYAKHNNEYRVDVETTVRHDAIETWVNTYIDAWQTDKRFNRIAKKSTVFRMVGDAPDAWRTLKRPYDADVQKHFDTHPNYAGKVAAIWGVTVHTTVSA